MANNDEAAPLGRDRNRRRIAQLQHQRWVDPQTGSVWVVTLQWVIVDNDLVCNAVTIEGNEAVSAETLRRVPIGRLKAEGKAGALADAEGLLRSPELTRRERKALRERMPAYETGRGGLPRVTAELLAEVADVKRRADRERPNETSLAVWEHFEASGRTVSMSTIHKWIGRARAEGLIPPATTGRKKKV